MNKDLKIRVGDLVRIIDPTFFIRCGYSYELPEAINDVLTNQGAMIKHLLESAGLDYNRLDDDFLKNDKIVKELAYRKVRKHMFSGAKDRERRLYTEVVPRFKDMEAVVIDKFVVKTGTYYPAFGGGYWEDYDPAGLDVKGTHLIVQLQLFDAEIAHTPRGTVFLNHIEAVRLEKLACGKNSSVSFLRSA